jgi:hypothetical protein
MVHPDSERPVDFREACFTRGATVSYDAHADADSAQSVGALLPSVFELNKVSSIFAKKR